MCKMNIAAYDKVNPPHRSTLHCWPLFLIAAYTMLPTEQNEIRVWFPLDCLQV
jgi:hypothetical protein